MATGDRKDPYRGFNFRVEIDNITVGAFSDVSGTATVPVDDFSRAQIEVTIAVRGEKR